MNKPEQPKVDYTNIVNTLGEGSQVIMVVSSTVGNTKYSMTKLADTSTFAIHAVNSLTAIGPPVEFVSPNPEDNCVPFKVGEELFCSEIIENFVTMGLERSMNLCNKLKITP